MECMTIKFPVMIQQVDNDTIKIVENPNGQPLIRVELHGDIESKLTMEQVETIHNKALIEAIRQSITIQ